MMKWRRSPPLNLGCQWKTSRCSQLLGQRPDQQAGREQPDHRQRPGDLADRSRGRQRPGLRTRSRAPASTYGRARASGLRASGVLSGEKPSRCRLRALTRGRRPLLDGGDLAAASTAGSSRCPSRLSSRFPRPPSAPSSATYAATAAGSSESVLDVHVMNAGSRTSARARARFACACPGWRPGRQARETPWLVVPIAGYPASEERESRGHVPGVRQEQGEWSVGEGRRRWPSMRHRTASIRTAATDGDRPGGHG